MPAYQTVVFDLDGTLLNTLEDLHLSTNAALATHDMPPHSIDDVRRFVGNGIRLLIHRAVPAGTDAATEEAVYEDFCAHYAAHCEDHTPASPSSWPTCAPPACAWPWSPTRATSPCRS